MAAIDVQRLKKDFPIFDNLVDGKRLVYLDSGSSSQRPQSVLDAMDRLYQTTYANVHRGVYTIAEEANREYEAARVKVGRFIGAPDPAHEVLFTKNATESLNLVATSWGRHNLSEGDVVVLTEIEHHANIVPWLMLKAELGIELRFIPLGEDGQLDLSNLDRLLAGAKLVGVTCASNVLGTIPPVRTISTAAHSAGALVVCDGSQYVPHVPTDVKQLGCDFLAFTGHKMCGPTGIGLLWAKVDLLEAMPPFLGGGMMIRDVRLDGFTPNELPWKFEAGTPPIAETVGLAAAVDYLQGVGMHTSTRARRRPYRLCHEDPRAAPRRRPDHPRTGGPMPAKRRLVTLLQGHTPPRPRPSARPVRRMRAGGPPLRKAPDAPPRRQRDRASLRIPV